MSGNKLSWFENYRRKRAAKRYARRLTPRLAKDYGRSEFYTKAQIDTVIKNLGLESKFVAIAYGGCWQKKSLRGGFTRCQSRCPMSRRGQDSCDTSASSCIREQGAPDRCVMEGEWTVGSKQGQTPNITHRERCNPAETR